MKQDKATFTHRNEANLFIVYDAWSRDLNKFALYCLFGSVKLNKNADSNKNGYSGYGIGFDACSQFSLLNEWGKNVVNLVVDNSLSVDTDNRKKIY